MEVNDLVVKCMSIVDSRIAVPFMGVELCSESSESAWGVFRIDPYHHGMQSPVEKSYKVVLTPVGIFAKLFRGGNFYCGDIFRTSPQGVSNFYHFGPDELDKAEAKAAALNYFEQNEQ